MELTILSVFTPLWLIGYKGCFLVTQIPHNTASRLACGVNMYREYSFNVHTYSPCFILLPAGLQLVVRDAETAPEELLFELRKPPQHGVLLKDTAEFQGPMATGSCLLCHWPTGRTSCYAVRFMCLRQEVSNFVGQSMRRYLKRTSVFSPSAEIFGTSFSVPPPMPQTMKLFPQIIGEIGWFLKPGVKILRTTSCELPAATFLWVVHGHEFAYLAMECKSSQYL